MENSIAVLPFVNGSQNADNDFLADGIAFTVLMQLAKVGDLNVIAKASSFMLRGTVESPQDIGRRLRVGRILQGVVQEHNGQLRVSAELVDTQTGQQVWAEVFDTTADDFFKIQDDISLALVEKMEITVSGVTTRAVIDRTTSNEEAWQLYLLGRFQYDLGGHDPTAKAHDYFHEAVEIDPNFALAWVGIADTLARYTVAIHDRENVLALRADEAMSREERNEWYREVVLVKQKAEADAAVEKALEIDPRLAAAHAVRGQAIYFFERDAEAALASTDRALELDPKHAPAHFFVASITLREQGKRASAHEHYDRAVALDPLNLEYLIWAGLNYAGQGDTDKGLDAFRLIVELDPDNRLGGFYPSVRLHAALLSMFAGRMADAMDWARDELALEGDLANNMGYVAYLYMISGDVETGDAWLARALELPDAMQHGGVGIALENQIIRRQDVEAARRWHREEYGDRRGGRISLASASLEEFAGDFNQARAHYAEALELDPNFFNREYPVWSDFCWVGAVNYAAVLYELGENELADEMLASGKAVVDAMYEQGTYNSAIHCVFAQIAALQGDSEKALDFLETSIEVGFRNKFSEFDDLPFKSLQGNPRFESLKRVIDTKLELELQKIREREPEWEAAEAKWKTQ
jgi:TolB-like protein/tetratricopeptide (TPR) repeat protein